jgi:hypothetical protein
LSDDVLDWAQVLVRFAPYPGPPAADEADLYDSWLAESPERRLIYIVRDFDAEQEYWAAVEAGLPQSERESERPRLEKLRAHAGNWPNSLPPRSTDPVDPSDWFGVVESTGEPSSVARLTGPWAEGVDAEKAALTIHDALDYDRVEGARLLLAGDDRPLVVEANAGFLEPRVLVLANASFLLNEPLTREARAPLAERVIAWVREHNPRRISFVEGTRLAGEIETVAPRSGLDLLQVDPLNWIFGHLFAVGLIGAFAAAARLGRPRRPGADPVGRPAAHAEALGDLLARTRDRDQSLESLERYHRWRAPR